MDSADNGTTIHFLTVATCLYTTFESTLADAAKTVAENSLPSIYTTAITVDMLWQDRRIIQFRPQLSSLFPQCLVIVLRGNVSVALLAVQPADGNQSLHTSTPYYPESTTIASS